MGGKETLGLFEVLLLGGKRAALSEETSFFKCFISGACEGWEDAFLQILNILHSPYGLPDVPWLLLAGPVSAVLVDLRGLIGSPLQD